MAADQATLKILDPIPLPVSPDGSGKKGKDKLLPTVLGNKGLLGKMSVLRSCSLKDIPMETVTEKAFSLRTSMLEGDAAAEAFLKV